MSFDDFLTLLTQNTKNQIETYKGLCRFCLQQKSEGIDIGGGSDNTKQQRDFLFNNHHIITKKYLAVSSEYPNFVCSSCESDLHQCAVFIQEIEKNAENWEMFLKRDDEVNVSDEYMINIIGMEEIKVEYCEENFDHPQYDASPPSLNYEESNEMVESQSQSQFEFVNYNDSLNDDDFTDTIREENVFNCNIGGSKYYDTNQQFAHMQDKHSEDATKYQCQFCTKLFSSENTLESHEKNHLNARSHTCKLCGESFKRKSMLSYHLNSQAHNGILKTTMKKYTKSSKRKQVYRCVLCIPPIVFSSLYERDAHKNLFHRNFECDICKNSFMSQETLNSHRLRHSDEPRPFVCTVCSATFHKKAHLASHYKRKHTNDRSIQCSHCDKTFFEEFELTRHVNFVHKKRQKRIKCGQCSSDFATERYLQIHVLQNHSK